MDFVAELLVQLLAAVLQALAQLLVEAALEDGVRRGLTRLDPRTAATARKVVRASAFRWALAALLGLAFGAFWGHFLDGRDHWPKLFWVSITFTGIALVTAFVRRATEEHTPAPERTRGWWSLVRDAPWHWRSDRWLGFVAVNAGLAVGIALTFSPAGGRGWWGG